MSNYDIARQFARLNGFDGAQPYEDGGELFMAVFYDPDAKTVSKWYPMFDNTPHIIVVDGNEGRWRSEEDAISIHREPIMTP